MKSSKTFLPEYEVLKELPGVFYETEKQYAVSVYGQNAPPFERAMAYGRSLVKHLEPSIFAQTDEGAEDHPDFELFERLWSVVRFWHRRRPQALTEALDAFSQDYVRNVAYPFGFTRELLRVFSPDFSGIPTRHLQQTLIQFGRDHEGGWESARRLIRWLEHWGKPVFEPLPEGSEEELPLEDQGYVVTRQLQRLYRSGLRSSDALVEAIWDITGVDIEQALASGRVGELRGKAAGIPNFDAELGTDAFGVYLPFHAYAFSKKTPWGIYIFLEPLLAWALDIWKTGEKHSVKDIFTLLFLVTYRHEMFHYHVERYAFMLEVVNRRPHYRPYLEKVRKPVQNTEKWLEEALAQAVIFPSAFIKNRTFLDRNEVLKLLSKEFLSFGPGYRDFDCKWTGGRTHGHKRLGTQIARGQDVSSEMEWVTDLAIPKTQYASDFKAVPGYFAFTPTIRSRFQFQTPRTADAKRFCQKYKDGKFDLGTGSSHQNWDVNGQKVQVVDRNGYVDLNSFKKLAKAIGISAFALKKEIQRA